MGRTSRENVIKSRQDFFNRIEQWDKQDESAERAKKNHNFFMLFKQRGSPAVRKMIRLNGTAAELFLFIAEHMDKANAIVGSGVAFAEALGVSESSISRAFKVLEQENYIARFKTGGSNVIVANPELVWSWWATGKTTCMFNNAKVLLSKSEQDPFLVKKFSTILKKNEPDEEAHDQASENDEH